MKRKASKVTRPSIKKTKQSYRLSILSFNLAVVLALADPALVVAADITDAGHQGRAAGAVKEAEVTLPAQIAAPGEGSALSADSEEERLRKLNERLGPRVWNIPFPSYADSLTMDTGGWRSKLADSGFGFVAYSNTISESNMLSTPPKIPATAPNGQPYPACHGRFPGFCAGSQAYVGEEPFIYTGLYGALTYDLSRWGVPDGQFVFAGQWVAYSSNNSFVSNGWLSPSELMYSQTLAHGAVELHVGLQRLGMEFVAPQIAGNFASTFGPSASIPFEMGLASEAGQPAVMAKINFTDKIYDRVAVGRSQAINGPTGDPDYDESQFNPTGFRFHVPNGGLLAINELGYQNHASPAEPSMWLRAGVIYNNSRFPDYSKLPANPSATNKGATSFYILADRQVWQVAPGSSSTAYRGLYVGASAMYAPASALGISQNYEARIYTVGFFDSRPQDVISLVYGHNVVSHYLANSTNAQTSAAFAAGFPVPEIRHSTNQITASYLARIRRGVFGSVGLAYTDHPSVSYFQGEGSALTLLGSLLIVF